MQAFCELTAAEEGEIRVAGVSVGARVAGCLDWLAASLTARFTAFSRSGPPRKGALRDEEYKDWIRTLACCASGVEGRSEAAHTGTDGGMSMKASDAGYPPCPANPGQQRLAEA